MVKRDNKGVELSINMIILMLLGLLILIIASYLIVNAVKEGLLWADNFPILDIEPDENNPIQFIPRALDAKKSNKMTIGFYNTEQQDISKNIMPKIECQGIPSVKVSASGLSIPVGEAKEYSALVTIPKKTVSNSYACTLRISKTEKSFFIDVK